VICALSTGERTTLGALLQELPFFGLNFQLLGVFLLDQMFFVQNPEEQKEEEKRKLKTVNLL